MPKQSDALRVRYFHAEHMLPAEAPASEIKSRLDKLKYDLSSRASFLCTDVLFASGIVPSAVDLQNLMGTADAGGFLTAGLTAGFFLGPFVIWYDPSQVKCDSAELRKLINRQFESRPLGHMRWRFCAAPERTLSSFCVHMQNAPHRGVLEYGFHAR